MTMHGSTCDAPWARQPAGPGLAMMLEQQLGEHSAPNTGTGRWADEGVPAPHGINEGGLLELVNACQRQVARFQALEAGALAAYRRARLADSRCWQDHLATEIDRFIVQEAAMATTISTRPTETLTMLGEDCMVRLPATGTAWRAGRITTAKAEVISSMTALIEDEDLLAQVETKALGWAPSITATRLRYKLRKLIGDLDPDAVVKRREKAVAMRSLQLWQNDDDSATLAGINLSPDLAERAYNRINAIARAAKADGDKRPIDQIRADTYLNLLLSQNPTASGNPGDDHDGGDGSHGGDPDDGDGDDGDGNGDDGDGNGPDGTSTRGDQGNDDNAGADGRGSDGSADRGAGRPECETVASCAARMLSALPAGTPTRQIAECARKLRDDLIGGGSPYCTTTTLPDGTVIHGRATYRPPRSMRKAIEARDVTCRFPSCNRKAVYCDLDHSCPHDRAGPTCLCNLQALCRSHHRLKQLPGWSLVHLWPGVICWITPFGNWHILTPGY